MIPAPTTPKPPRLAVQAFWLTFSKIAVALINVGVPIFLARHMEQKEYGVYKQVFLFAGVAMYIATLGVGTSAFYFLPRRPDRRGQVVFNITLYNLVMGAVPLLILVLYPDILKDVFRVPNLQAYAASLGILVLLQCLSGFLHQIPSALQDVRSSTILITGSQLAKAAIFAVAALISPSVRSILTAAIVYQSWQVFLLFQYLSRKFGKFWTDFDRVFFREQVLHALPLGAYGVLCVLRREMHNFFVSGTFPAAQFAVYAVGSMQTPFVPIIVESVSMVLLVRVSELQHQGRHRDIIHLLTRSINRMAGILFPIVAILFVTRRDLIVLLYTQAYEASASIYAVNLLPLALTVFMFDSVVQAYRELRRRVLTMQIIIFGAMLCFLYYAIGQLGMIGAILVAVAANVIERTLLMVMCSRAVGAKPADLWLLADLGKVACVAAGAAVVATFARDMFPLHQLIHRLAAAGICFGALYFAGIWIFRLPGRELMSREYVRGMAQKVRSRLRRK